MSVRNRIMALQGYVGSDIASVAALPLGASVGNVFQVTGSTAITSMTVASSLASAGREVTLYFPTAGVTIPHSAASILLRRPFVSAAGSVLKLYCDGTLWREVARTGDAPITKSLGTAEALIELAYVAVGTNDRVAGIIRYAVFVSDGTDFQLRSGIMPFSAVSKNTTITAAGNTVSTEAESLASSSGTLTSAITIVADTARIIVKAQPVSSLTQTSANIRYIIEITDYGTVSGSGIITPI